MKMLVYHDGTATMCESAAEATLVLPAKVLEGMALLDAAFDNGEARIEDVGWAYDNTLIRVYRVLPD